ncbi:hypothetical protein NQ317_012426 [Molorchus minor]|uniref:Uncharacterized protein n=1 Tax=Molorchus minor TaxID=1323400 RepID=A0ABQ9JB81_9CUCU|nr:hypothetical protein NQ317_012426 [Molorchus minor]
MKPIPAICYRNGGCRHGVAFLLWLHRRSESVTSAECYWKKSALSKVGTAKMDLQSLLCKDLPLLPPKDYSYVQKVIAEAPQARGGIFETTKRTVQHQHTSVEAFINFLKTTMTDEACKTGERDTREQSKSSLWYEFRFGRITASKIYEAARCKTVGTLVENIMESGVLHEVEKIKGITITRVGLFLDKNYPLFG